MAQRLHSRSTTGPWRLHDGWGRCVNHMYMVTPCQSGRDLSVFALLNGCVREDVAAVLCRKQLWLTGFLLLGTLRFADFAFVGLKTHEFGSAAKALAQW